MSDFHYYQVRLFQGRKQENLWLKTFKKVRHTLKILQHLLTIKVCRIILRHCEVKDWIWYLGNINPHTGLHFFYYQSLQYTMNSKKPTFISFKQAFIFLLDFLNLFTLCAILKYNHRPK